MRRSASGLFATSVYCEVDGLPAMLDTAGLSGAGAFVLTHTPAAIDRELELFLRSEAGEITLQGQVVQVIDVERASREGRAPGFGVLFTNLGDTQRAWLDKTRAALARVAKERIETARTVASMPGVSPPGAAQRPRTATPPASPSMTPSAPRTANPQISPEAQNLVRRMREELDELSKAPPWRVLDVDSTCSAARAKAAFFSASKQFHPHLFARHNCPELDQLVTELFILHKRAFTSLTLAANARSPRTPSATHRMAPVITQSGPPPAAEPEPSGVQKSVAKPYTTHRSDRPAPRSPSDRPPGDPEAAVRARVQMMVTDALKNLAAGRLAEAHAQLQQAFDLDRGYNQAELWLSICQARLAKADDRMLLAVEHYGRVLKLDPQNREALAAIRAAGPSGETTTKKLFGKLFGAGKD